MSPAHRFPPLRLETIRFASAGDDPGPLWAFALSASPRPFEAMIGELRPLDVRVPHPERRLTLGRRRSP